jgi:hypothetical protein
MSTLRALIAAGLLLACCNAALATLPPPTPEEQAKADASAEKEKAAVAENKAATARAQDRVAARYIAEQKAKGIIVHPTPTDGSAHAGPMTAQGNTPAESTTEESPERESGAKGAGRDATGPDASKETHRK